MYAQVILVSTFITCTLSLGDFAHVHYLFNLINSHQIDTPDCREWKITFCLRYRIASYKWPKYGQICFDYSSSLIFTLCNNLASSWLMSYSLNTRGCVPVHAHYSNLPNFVCLQGGNLAFKCHWIWSKLIEIATSIYLFLVRNQCCSRDRFRDLTLMLK